ncbi:putative F-box protein [Raphanus sativus]|uniref:F-box protein At3g52320 n=1 Tax=Raphanus sativus TaxID=3726 RepID=A0A6J0JGL3_RAPSA|nr:putative F-box protein At3g52320 [Raphanus sativus]KAJ4890125.1 putative F-box protein [Raphanus sativus]
MVGLSFRIAVVKGLRKKKKMKRSKVKRNRRVLLYKLDSKPPVTVDLPELPEDVLMQILARLPAKLLMQFKCVSRLWYSIISSRYFANLFRKVASPLRERRLFMYLVDKNGHGDYALLSKLIKNLKANTFQLQEYVTIPGMGGCLVNVLEGLMCCRIGRSVRICNLTTKQHVELPIVVSNISGDNSSNMWNHFGYDPIQEEYKVISLTWEMAQERVVRSEYHVLVLGPGASWRRITQSVPPHHHPCSQGVSMDGVLYYGALTGDNTFLVVSFNMSSEKFNLIKLPLHAAGTNLMNYGGKLAVFDCSPAHLASDRSLDLWVLEDESQWSNKKTFVLPISNIVVIIPGELSVQGTSREGMVMVFSKTAYSSLHLICDLHSCKMIEGVLLSKLRERLPFETESLHRTYWDDFESIMYLET